MASEWMDTPDGWSVKLEDKHPSVTSSDSGSWEAVWIEVEGPSNTLSPARRLAISSRLAEQAAQEWAAEHGLGSPRFMVAKTDNWSSDGRFTQGRAYQASK